MSLKQKVSLSNKNTLSVAMHSWLPILKMDINDLPSYIEEKLKDNPFAKVIVKQRISLTPLMNANSSDIEVMNHYEHSLYDKLQEQIDSKLFPTPKSRKIALSIVEGLDENGYFKDDIAKLSKQLGISKIEFEKIRNRFKFLEPVGVGAKDLKESLLFQLDDLDIEDALYNMCLKLIMNFENMKQFMNEKLYKNALGIVKKFKNPPAIDYFEKSQDIIPEAFVIEEEGEITVKLNDYYYPEIVIQQSSENSKFTKEKFQEAKNLLDAVEMRKHTLYSVVLMLIEYQYDFFFGKKLKPLKLEDIATELERSVSTISRAISNKYIASKRGILPIKSFFSKNVGSGVAQAEIKNFLKNMVEAEDKTKPLPDRLLVQKINEEFKLSFSEKAINKYRRALNIPSSRDRKGMI